MTREKARAVLEIWERGERQHPIDRALTILLRVFGDSRTNLADLPIGQRDARLCEARRAIFGNDIAPYTQCLACDHAIQLRIHVTDLLDGTTADRVRVETALGPLEIRVPTSRDLASIIGCDDSAKAGAILRERCGVPSNLSAVDEAAIDYAVERAAGSALIRIATRCPVCDKECSVRFDAGAYLWDELCAYAERLLNDIDLLARRYSWSENAILSMSDSRRQRYVEFAHD